MKKTQLWMSVLLAVLFMVALLASSPLVGARQGDVTATPTRSPHEIKTLATIAQDYPRVDGSTSTHPLQMQIACVVFGLTCQVIIPYFEPTPTVQPDSTTVSLPDIQHTGTHSAYMNLIERETDLILVARAPSEDELASAQKRGVEFDAQPVALDAFVFLLHPSNPIDDLSLDDVRAIYTGQITDWAELGVKAADEDTTIRAYQRERNSGSRELMDKMVMFDEPMIEGEDLMVFTMSGLIEAVAHYRWGIGYSVYYYVTNMSLRAAWEEIKMPAIEGVVPTSATIQDRSYPLTAEVYVVVRKDMPANSTAIQLRDWLLTPSGQAAVEQSGYVGL